ncbi:DUF2812 domain-containing protein [Erysipelothrix aquatica]|uniref:DUF2812 domain-containing protein n=1 Tax=Erysipelothrix aquatica TaxID=2683714 RepID=UPI0013568D73|nr:DUF2812 domain-containing protein [Erysipelothrix aquatica]
MIEKKYFGLDQVADEIRYLEAKEGYILKTFDGERYTFEPTDEGPFTYAVHFSVEPASLQKFTDVGFTVCCEYLGSQGGYYYFLTRPQTITQPVPHNYDDRKDAIQLKVNRVDRFVGVVLIAVIFLYAYFFMKNMNGLYLIVLIPTLGLAAYVYAVRQRYLRFIKNN